MRSKKLGDFGYGNYLPEFDPIFSLVVLYKMNIFNLVASNKNKLRN
ncbi:hypothetical protein [Mastigocoleus testarum]|nr:hypothetical protein [Mastigocoleus testarum]